MADVWCERTQLTLVRYVRYDRWGSSDCRQRLLRGLDLMAEDWWLMSDVWSLTGEGREGFGESSKQWSCYSYYSYTVIFFFFFFSQILLIILYIYLIINKIYNNKRKKRRIWYPSKKNCNNCNCNANALKMSSKIQKHCKIRCPVKSTVSRFYPQMQDN